jgi:hypothetical protein
MSGRRKNGSTVVSTEETFTERKLVFSGTGDESDRTVRIRSEAGELKVIAPCGEERELDEKEAELVHDVLNLLADLIEHDGLTEVFTAFYEAKNEAF